MLLVLVSFLYCFNLLCVFYDIGSDGMVTLWERAAHLVYNMFSVPCQEKIIESEQGYVTFIIVDCMLR